MIRDGAVGSRPGGRAPRAELVRSERLLRAPHPRAYRHLTYWVTAQEPSLPRARARNLTLEGRPESTALYPGEGTTGAAGLAVPGRSGPTAVNEQGNDHFFRQAAYA